MEEQDKLSQLYEAISQDVVYKNLVPKTEAEFRSKVVSDKNFSSQMYEGLKADTVYGALLPNDYSGFEKDFVPKSAPKTSMGMDMAEATNPGSTKVEGSVDMTNQDAVPSPDEVKKAKGVAAKNKYVDNETVQKQKRSNGLEPGVHEQEVLEQAKLAEAKVMAAKQNALYFYDDNKLVPYEKPQTGLVNKQPEDNMGFSVTPNPEVANMKQTVDYYAKFLAENDPIKYDAYKSKLKYLEGGGFIGKAPETDALNKEQALFTEDAIKFRSDLAGLKIKQIEEEIGKDALDALKGLNDQLGVIAKEYDAAKDPAQKNAIAEKYNAASAEVKQLLTENGLEDKLKSMDEAYKSASSSISAGQTFVQQFPKYAAEKLQAEQDQEMVDLKNEYKTGAGGFADRYGYNITSQLGRGITRMVGGIMGLPQSLSFNNDYGATDRWADIFSEGTKHFDEEFLPQPKKFENSLFKDDGKIDTSLLLPKSVGMLTDMAILIGGGMATGGGLVAAGMGNTKLALSVGTVASSFAMTNKGYYDEAIKGGMSSKGASAFASVLSLQQGLLELINPEAVIFRKQLSTRVTKNFIDNLLSGVSTKEAFGLASKAVFKNIVGENIQELSQTIDEKISKFAAYKLFGAEFENMDMTANEVAETVVLTTIASGLTGGVLGGMSEQRSDLEKQSLYTASVNVNETIAAIAKKVADGTMTQTQADIIQTAVVRLNSNLNILPGHLTEQQKSDIVNLMYDKTKIEAGIANDNIDPLLKTKGEEQIKLIDTEIEKILEQGQPNYEIDGKAVTKQEFTQQIADPAFKEAVKSGKTNIKITNDQAFVDTVNSALGFDHTGEKAAPEQDPVNPGPTPEQQQQIAVLNENRAIELANNEKLPPEEQVAPEVIEAKFDNDIKMLMAQPVLVQLGAIPVENGGQQQDEAGVAGADNVAPTPEQVQAENEKAKVDNEKQAKIADIEKRREEELAKDENVEMLYPIDLGDNLSNEDKERVAKNEADKKQRQENRDAVNAKYDAELAALNEAENANNKAGSQDNNNEQDKGKPAEDKKSEDDKPGEGDEQSGGKLAIDVLHGLVKRFNGINKPERKNNPALVDALRAKINEIASQIGLKVVDVPGRGKSFIQLEDKKGKPVKPAPEKIKVKPLSEFEEGDVVYSPSDKSKYEVLKNGEYKDVKENSKNYGKIVKLDPNKTFTLYRSAAQNKAINQRNAALGMTPSSIRSATLQMIASGYLLSQELAEHIFGKKMAHKDMKWTWFANEKRMARKTIGSIDHYAERISEAMGEHIDPQTMDVNIIRDAWSEVGNAEHALEKFIEEEGLAKDGEIGSDGNVEIDVEKQQREMQNDMVDAVNAFFEENGIMDEANRVELVNMFGGIGNLNMVDLQDFLDESKFNADVFAEIDPTEEAQVMAEMQQFRDENGDVDLDALEKNLESIKDEKVKEIIKNYINDTKNKGVESTGSGKNNADGSKDQKVSEQEKAGPPARSREEIIADIEAKKIEVAAAQVEYDKAKKALDKDLQAKQANLFAGGIEQKMFNDEAELAKEVENRKKKLGALMDELNVLNTILENNLEGQQPMDFGGDNVAEEPKPILQKTVQGDLFSSLVEGDYPVAEPKKGKSKAKKMVGITARTIRTAWTVMKNIQFTGSTRVESAADVAEIMKLLENKAVEHAFAVHIDKNGNSHIQFLSIGSRVQTVIDPRQVLDGAAKFKSVKVYLVHNHPTGNMKPSQADINITKSIGDGLALLKIDLEHVIMDTYKKEYVLLQPSGSYTVEDRGSEKNNTPLETHYYSELEIMSKPLVEKITSSREAALTIQQLRFTAMPKNAMLMLDRANNVIANYVFTGEVTLKKVNDALAEIGAAGVLFYGNNINTLHVNNLIPSLKKMDVNVVDIIQTASDGADVVGFYRSMGDQGTLREDQEKYKTGPDSLPEVNEPDAPKKSQPKTTSLTVNGREVQVKPVHADVVNGFYSNTENALAQVKQEKMSGSQWATQLLSRGANKEEMKWNGLEGFLKENSAKPVSKADIQQYLKDNRIQVVEVVGSESEGNLPKSPMRSNITSLQLEGEKENYKEVLVTMPQKTEKANYEVVKKGDLYYPTDKVRNIPTSPYPTFEQAKAESDRLNKGAVERTSKDTFHSSHFDEPNILVHLRMNTRTDAEGNKVLFLEEVQSDWGQKGKKEGFKEFKLPTIDNMDLVKVDNGDGKYLYQLKDNNGLQHADLTDFEIKAYKLNSEAEIKKELYDKAKQYEQNENLRNVAKAPFVTDTNAWTKLGLKVALKEAVKQGADKLAWTTGEQQNDRYDLSKQVDKIDVEAVEDVDGLHFVDIKLSNGTTENLEVENGIIREGNYKGQRLDNVIGKDYADKVLSTPQGENKTLEGADLKVGGKGMKGFYGSPTEGSLGVVGNVAKSLFKQEVGTVEIKNKNGEIRQASWNRGVYELIDENGDVINRYGNKDAVMKAVATSTQHSIDITPELKASVQQGQPLFKVGEEMPAGDEIDPNIDNNPDANLKEQIANFGVAKKDTEAQIGLIEKLFSGLKKAGLVAAKNVEDWVNIGKGNSKKQALNDVIIAANIQKVASSLGFDLGLPLDISGTSLKKQAQEQLPVNTPVANGYDVIKKKLGETAAKAVRQHIPFALDYPNEFIAFITEKIPVKESIAEIVVAIPARLEVLFRISADKTIETTTAPVSTPEELANGAGYVFHRPSNESDVMAFKKDFQNGEVLCTYNNVSGRMSGNLIFWIRRANAETVLHATEVTQEYLTENTEGAQLWRGYLDARGLKKADGTYDIANLRPERQDPYGTSSMSVQIGKSNGILSIKNRYNHTVSSPDATFGNDLNNIASGLDAAVYAVPGVPSKSKQQTSLPHGLTSDASGRFFRYDYESNNVYFSRLGYMKHGVITAIDKSTQAIRDEVLFDAKKKIALNLASTEQLAEGIESVSIQKDNITVKTKNGSLVLGLLPINGNVISVSGDIKTIGSDFFWLNETIRSVDLPNAVSIGRGFLQSCTTVQKVVMPMAKSIGVNFIYAGRNVSQIELPSVEMIGSSFLSSNQELDAVSFPNLVEVGDDFIRQNQSIDRFDLPSLKTVGDNFMSASRGYGDINMPSVESVGSSFMMSTGASNVSMPVVKIVGRNFMYRANGITKIDLPDLQSVGDSFLSFNQIIEEVSLPSLQMIGSGFLAENNSLEEISLPKATHVGSGFMINALNLKSISLPNAIRLGSEFAISATMVESVHMPKVSRIDNSFMSYNRKLKSISLPNLSIVDSFFLSGNTEIKSVSLPKATNIRSMFLRDNNSLETLEAPFVQEIWDEFLENNNSIKSLFFPALVSAGSDFMPKNAVLDRFYAPRIVSIGNNFLSSSAKYVQLSGYVKRYAKEWRVIKDNALIDTSTDKAKMEAVQKANEGSTLMANTVGQPLLKKAQAQYRVESGKNIVEALQNFNGSPAATVALTHEIMHPTVVAIFDGAKEGNETGLKHANTIVDEYNKANPRNKVTLDEMIADNDAFKEGSTSDNYRNVQEFIAESWEQYNYEGKQGFSKAFQDVLDQITEAFKAVYKSLSGKELTPELRQMFDDILGKVAPQKEVPGTSFGDNTSFTNVNGTDVTPAIQVSKKLQTELSKIASENKGKRTENGYTFETKDDAERAATQMQAAYYNEISPRTLTLDEKIEKAFDNLKAVKSKIKASDKNLGIASSQAENDAELLAAYTNLAYLFIKKGLQTAKDFIEQLKGPVNEAVAQKAYNNALNSIMEFKKNFKKDRENGMGLKELMAKYASKEFDLDYIVDEWNGATDDISPEEAAYASTGVFDDTAPKTKSSDGKLSPMEVPELVQLAKAIMGKYPTVERLQHALGMFVPSKEQLRITNEMFKAENLEDLAKVLAHEIGHVIDFMPDKAMGKGNILGRLASIRDFMGKILPFKEGMPGALTKDDIDRLTAEAKALNPDGKTITMIEEEIEKEFGITADDVKAIWNAIDPSQKNKALEDYIKGLSDKQKALIVKAAMKGMVADELKNFITKVKVKTGNMIAVETIVKGEWKKTLDKLIQDEIAKRQAFELKKIHDEALALSVWWRPMSENPTAKERSYRHSSVEIYADMISVLFNSPGEFEKRAPNVMKAFFNYFDKKPEVKAAYEELMAAISDPETIAQQRLQNMLDANKRGTEAYKAARAAKETVNLWTLFKRQFLSVSYPLLDKFVNESVPGLIMSEKQRLRQALDMMNYASGRVFDVMSSYEKNVINPLTAAGVDLNDMSALLQARRNIGDRSDIANPLGMQGELVNQGMIDKVMSKYTPEQQDVINKALDTFYALTFETMKKGNDAGLYTKDMWDTIEKNKDSYATYRVIKYIDGKLVSAGLYEATGTLQEVANPFFETMVKMTQIEKAIIRNNAVKIAVEMLVKHHPDDIKFARRISKSSFQHAPAGWGSLNYKVQGRTVSVHTDKRIVEIFNKFSPHEVSALFQFWGKANVLFKGIYTGFNYSFGLVRNPVKDSMRSIRAITAILHGHKETKRLKNVVTVPLVYAKNFLKSLPASAKLASGITTQLTHDMIESGAVSPESILYSDYDAFANPEMQMLGRFKEVSEHLGMDSSTGRTKWKNALRALGYLPSILEYNSKIASYRTFLDYGLSSGLAAYHTRINTGTPDFKERTGLNYGNFMYAKTTLQGLRAEVGLIADPVTRAGYFLSLFVQVVPAALAYVAFTKGWFGGDDDDDKELASTPNESIKRQFMMESSWDKLRYITIPTGLTEDKTKVGRVKIPMDEMQALFYGAIINTFSDVPVSEKFKNQLTSLGGLVPALINPEDGMPMWEIFSKWTDYAKGNNPVDNFRNQPIVNQNKMKAGFIYSAPDMLAWTAGKFNVKFDYKNPNATAKDFMKNNIPVWSAIYSETNFGDIEEIQRIKKEVDSRRAAHNIDIDQAIQKEYNSSLGAEIEKSKTDLNQWDNGFPTMYYTDSKVSSIVLNTFIKMFPDTKLPPVNPETGWFKDDGSEAYADISYMKQKAKAYYMYGLTSNSSVYMNSLIDANRETKSLIIEKYSGIEPGMAEGFINFAYRNGIIDEKTKVMSLDALNNK